MILIDVLAARRASVSPLPAINNVQTASPRSSSTAGRSSARRRDRATRWDWVARTAGRQPPRALPHLEILAVQPQCDQRTAEPGAQCPGSATRPPPEGLGLLEDSLNQDHLIQRSAAPRSPRCGGRGASRMRCKCSTSEDPDDKRELLSHSPIAVFVQRVGREGDRISPGTSSRNFVRWRTTPRRRAMSEG